MVTMTHPAAPDTESTAPSAPSHRALSVGVVAGIFATAFEAIAVGTAMPAAAEDLGNLPLYAWAFSLFTVGMLAANILGGRMADRFGPVRPLAIGGIVFTAGLVIGGLATSMEMLLAARLVQGIGAGALNVSLFVLIALVFSEAERAKVMTLLSAAWVVPGFVGPPIAGWVTREFSWHWVFLGIIPLLAASAALVVPVIIRLGRTGVLDPDAESEANPVPIWAGFTLALGAVALQFAGQRAGQPETRDAIALLAALAGVAVLVFTLPKVMPPGLFRLAKGLPAVAVARAMAAGAFFGAESFIPLMLVRTRGLDYAWAGLVLTIGSSGWFVGAWLQSRRWLTWSRTTLIILGTVSIAIGTTGAALVALLPGLPLWVAMAMWSFSGLGMGFVVALTSLAAMTLSSRAQQGRNASAMQAAEALGNSLFVGIAGTIFAALVPIATLHNTFGAVLGAMTVVALFGFIAALRIGAVSAPQ